MTTDDAAPTFEPHRRYLAGLAYRMLGSVAEAEDVVQDAFLRWNATDRRDVVTPRAFLSRTVTRLCLDRLKSARVQREEYVGTWLPEPVIGAPGAETTTSLAEDLSIALLLTLERLSPLERAAFLLHDVFDMEFAEVAGVLDRSEAACRQLATRARTHVREERPRFQPAADTATRLTDAFHAAILGGDVQSLGRLLAADAVLYTDGGGKRRAALNPIYGRDKILRFFIGVAGKRGAPEYLSIERVTINGLPGVLVRDHGEIETLAIETADDVIVALYSVRNPDKLRHLA